ncbi:endopeptidase O [Entomoplasma ellychniae]|uniref:Endopeptidase O n=1 Tax=Entomoplasma ellychniae TaxID=2114 RepID=A0A8E2R057_9MOLU|nr:M13 family metallopeptidase [Entomoplasma ellychniae]PPE05035.1 endopeptidase O [Entomoplasma ellychniae]
MSIKVRAQDNFYDHINKEWLDKTELPEGYASWGSFEMLDKKSNDDIKNIIKNLQKQKDISKESKFIVNLYENYLNDEARAKDGINPIIPIIKEIDQLSDFKDLTNLMISLYKKYHISFFHSKGITADFKDSNLRALAIESMSLGMSNREFYERSNPRHEEIKAAYKVFVEELAKTSTIKFASKNLFELVFNFEDKIAKHMLKPEEFRDPARIYNIMTISEIQKICDFIDWKSYLNALSYDQAAKIIVVEPKYLEEISKQVKATNIEDLKDIMKFGVIEDYASILSPELYEINFNFSSVFSGVKKKRPVEERAVRFVNGSLGELLSKEYIKHHFSENAKKDVLKMVKNLFEKYIIRINALEWMTPETKIKAIEKVKSFTVKIGYPDKWEDYSDIVVESYTNNSSLFENLLSLKKHNYNKEIRDINLPVDKEEWHMYAQTVNAYYNPSSNEICFPAGILQKPFYDENQSHAANLGGIGAVIGHEVSHGFDDEGSQFDKDGNFKNWWTEKDHKEYSKRTQAVVDQYNQYEIVDTKVNGKLTCGENIGDLSGVSAALDICKEEASDSLKEFFENYALVWCRKSTPEQMNFRVLTDPHSPEIFRCNGVLVNIDEFHDLYKTKPGDKMYKPKEERVKVW